MTALHSIVITVATVLLCVTVVKCLVIRKTYKDDGNYQDTIMDQISKVNEIKRKKRNAVRQRKKLWPKRIVPYEISSGMEAYVDNILEAIKEFHRHTCIRFVQKTNERNWLKFTQDKGCWSYIGRIYWRKGAQKLSLGKRCNTKGIIMHEMMHGVGFWHEQSRPDRNKFVEILWENIQDRMDTQFNKYKANKVDNLGFTYDYQSIMHYGKKTFSRNGLPTIRALHNPSMPLGRIDGFSPMDIQKMNNLYECSQSKTEGWSEWSRFSSCNIRCVKSRQRICFSSEDGSCPGSDSSRVQTQRRRCSHKECNSPIDGQWARWGKWKPCNKDCGYGIQERQRICMEPKPKNGGKDCIGANTQKRMCNMVSCPTDKEKCNFEKDFCQWENSWSTAVTFHWRRHHGKTPSRNTGPMGDHTSGSGYYAYLETSWPARHGYTSTLSSRWHKASDARCLTFWYSMHGRSVGSLRVYITDDLSVKRLLWLRSGQQGYAWKKSSIEISSTSKYKVMFEGVRGNGYTGDIALDDISFINGKCDEPHSMYRHMKIIR
ncbi:zinc metalloproteinase nas-14 isoform X2 [Exaiptasia diaphana]|uniref:Metalloendopeptidase n=1 Tax=Exaiptasia diaphana TaxID=2652724 RepID=A0A913XJ65_EXADI|nr:zinc metalloproteinase nas-14 isoform X2 [Exaiptasia diaphana]